MNTENSPRSPLEDLVGRLREAANEIARNGHAGWGNQMTEAADEIERLQDELCEWRQMHMAIAKVIEFEDAFRAAMLRRKPSMPPNYNSTPEPGCCTRCSPRAPLWSSRLAERVQALG